MFLWTAATCRRYSRFADLSAKPPRVQWLEKTTCSTFSFDGDKSPAKSADESAHSKPKRLQHQLPLETFVSIGG